MQSQDSEQVSVYNVCCLNALSVVLRNIHEFRHLKHTPTALVLQQYPNRDSERAHYVISASHDSVL